MKKSVSLLSVLIGVVLIAMFLPWAYLWGDALQDGIVYRPQPGYFLPALAYGDFWPALSFGLALLSLIFALFSGKKPAFRVVCGLLLLGSAGACIAEGIMFTFDCFTVLTWAIFGALVVLGLWALFFSGRKATKAS